MRNILPKINLLKEKRLWVCALLSTLLLISCKPESKTHPTKEIKFSVSGEVNNVLEMSLPELKKMPGFFIKDVLLIREKDGNCDQPEELIDGAAFRGVLLRDILLKAGMKYVRKWEPGVFIHVYGANNKEVVFSFGEVFYSSIGRSILVAYEKNHEEMHFDEGIGDLIVSTDLRAGRWIHGISRIVVERVDVQMKAYDDKKQNVVRPPTREFTLIDHKTGKSQIVDLGLMQRLPRVYLPFAVMAGDCEGFRGIHSFEGGLLKDLLVQFGITPCRPEYNRYVLVSSEDGFCATFSFGELFNSRLNNNLLIAYKKDEQFLNEADGFAKTVAGEDNLGGRSVKRIYKIEIF